MATPLHSIPADGPAPVIHVVDDDPAFRAAIRDLLSACDFRVELHASACNLLERLPSDEPGCILIDVQMAGCSGPELQDRLTAMGSTAPVIFVTGHGDIPTSVRTIKAGAEDFLTKPVAKERLFEANERALVHDAEVRIRESNRATLRKAIATLTTREYEVFSLLVRGKPHKQIAYTLRITERTVKFHRRRLLQKLGAHSLADLVVTAERLGLLSEQGSYT